MIIKDTLKILELTNNTLYFKSLFRKLEISYSNIDHLNIDVPKYDSIPGSGSCYDYTFLIFIKDTKPLNFNIVLDREEEKKLLKLLKEYNINHSISYYDNKHSDTD